MTAEAQFWVALPGSTEQPLGPLDLKEVGARLNAGTLPKTATACEVGGTEWVPVQDILPKPARKLGSRFKVIGLGAIGLLVVAVGAAVAVKTLASKHKALPIVAQKLPPQAKEVVQSRLRADLYEVAALPDSYVASALAAEACGGKDVGVVLGWARNKDLATLKTSGVLDLTSSPQIKAGLVCGEAIRKTILAPSVVEVSFVEGEKPFRVSIIRATMPDLPTELGLVRHNFSSLAGACFKTSDSKTDCADDAQATFHDGQTWVFGKVAAIEAFARAYTSVRNELTTTVDILQETIASTTDADVIEITAKPDAVPWASPCEMTGPVEHKREFLEACFPKGQEKLLDSIVTKVRGLAIERDILAKAAAYHLGFVLLARDEDAARDVEKDLQDLVRDWRAQLANSEPEMAKLVRAKSDFVRDEFWKAAFDAFMRAMRGMSVSRNGAVVRLSIHEPLRPEESKALKEFVETRTQDQTATSKIIEAILQGTPVPEKSLGVFVDADVAAWMSLPKATEADCDAIGLKVKALSKDVPIEQFGMKFKMEQRFAKSACSGQAWSAEGKACGMAASDLTSLAACKAPTNVFVQMASRKLQGAWVGDSVEPDIEKAERFWVGSKLDFGSNGHVSFTTSAGGNPLEGDADIQSEGQKASFKFPIPGRTDRLTVTFAGDDKFTMSDRHTVITYKRATK
jgi:hypothetical protein